MSNDKQPDEKPPQFDDVLKRMLDTKPQPKAPAKPAPKPSKDSQ